MKMEQFKQSEETLIALKSLRKKDKILAKYASNELNIKDLMPVKKENNLAFSKLTEIIIGQQLSGSAADKIYSRFKDTLNLEHNFRAENLKSLTQLQIRNCGISNSKAKFILALRDKIILEDDFFDELENYSDSTLELELTKLKGIGNWTAKIFMMSHYGRLDIFPETDGTLVKAISLMNYNDDSLISISEKWKPYRTIASRIIWNSYDLGLIK